MPLSFLAIGVLLLGSLNAVAEEVASASDKQDIIQELLAFPAPPPESIEPARFTYDSPPPEDAPLDVIGRYWGRSARPNLASVTYGQSSGSNRTPITMKTRERLVEACQEYPELAPSLLGLLPQTPEVKDILKQLYDEKIDRMGETWGEHLKKYLKMNSRHFREELIADALEVKDDEDGGYVSNREELEALASLDWDEAEPILKKFAKDQMPRRAVLAKSLLYTHYSAQNDHSISNSMRNELKAIVEDREALGFSRDEAAEALFSTEWDGRDQWFLSLFSDDSLRKLHDGIYLRAPLTSVVREDPDHWIPIVTTLLSHNDRAVHDNAVECLIQFQLRSARPDALMPLFPWLMDPQWSSASDRLRLIQSIDMLDLKEGVPGLIAVLNQDVNEAERGYAADSLVHFRDARAIPALRRGLPSIKRSHHRRMFISALMASGGIQDSEAAIAVESYAKMLTTEDGQEAIYEDTYLYPDEPLPVEVSIGQYLAEREVPNEGTISLLLQRAEELKDRDLQLSLIIRDIVHQWPSKTGDRDIARMIRANTVPAASVFYALARREEFKKNCEEDIPEANELSGTAEGMFAVLSGDSQREISILKSDDIDAQKALLACARLVRDPLPLDGVERLFKSNNQPMNEAALAYLMTEDSSHARQIISEASDGLVIVGARQRGGDPGHHSYSDFDRLEGDLLALMSGENNYDEVLAMLTAGYWGDAGQTVIARRGTVVTITFYDDSERRYRRTLKKEEFDQFINFIDLEKVDDQGPLEQGIADGMQYEYVHITPNQGRRVFMNNPGMSDSGGSVYDRLCGLFSRLLHAEPLTIEYPELKELHGFKVLIADNRFSVWFFWKDAKTERLMIYPRSDSRTGDEAFSNLGMVQIHNSLSRSDDPIWVSIKNGKMNPDSAPSLFPPDNPDSTVPDEFNEYNKEKQPPGVWRLANGSSVYRVGDYLGKNGFWRFEPGKPPELLVEDNVLFPVLSSDGKWALLAKSKGSWVDPNIIVRVDLSSGDLSPVEIPEADTLNPVAYIPERKQFLVLRDKDDDPYGSREPVGPETPEYWLLDPETGKAEITKSEIQPLTHLGARSLQPAGDSGQYWAAIPNDDGNGSNIGKFDKRSFEFKPVLHIPGLRLNSLDIWVDEEQKAVYIAYRGHLLQVSLPQP